MRRGRLSIVAPCLLAGCASWTPPAPALTPPAGLTAPCPDLGPSAVRDMGDLLAVCVDDANMYRLCAARHRALAEWARGPR